ncbi:hypothetical protein ACFL3D_05765 [Candidatus Omnitrophota bacterium]
MDNSIIITLDMDWAPDEVVQDALDLLDEYQMKATLFMTNPTSVNIANHEIGIHPDFSTTHIEQHIKEAKKHFPKAKGIRSHSLFFTERLRPLYALYNIEYQSNVMMYRKTNIEPFFISRTTVELPLFWMDTFYMEMEDAPRFLFEEFNLSADGLKVFCFHPIHIFLNTFSLEHYRNAKKDYNNPDKLITLRNKAVRGVRDIFCDLMGYCRSHTLMPRVLEEVNRDFRKGTKCS